MQVKQAPKTEYQLIVELRDQVAARIISQKASRKYWELEIINSRKNAQENLENKQKVAINTDLIKADEKYLKVIDGMLEAQNGNS